MAPGLPQNDAFHLTDESAAGDAVAPLELSEGENVEGWYGSALEEELAVADGHGLARVLLPGPDVHVGDAPPELHDLGTRT